MRLTIINKFKAILLLCISLTSFAQANFQFNANPESALFRGQATVNGIAAEAIDSIAAFDENGICVGADSLIINNGIAYINLQIYGNDPTTSNDDGMDIGEVFTLKLYDASSNQVLDYKENGIVATFANWQNTQGIPLPQYSDPTVVYNFLSTTFELSLNVLLEGNYNASTQSMPNTLQQNGLLPLSNPYTVAPWNHPEAITLNSATDIPNNTVDWVLVEMRSGIPALSGSATTILEETKVGFLLTDGSIVGVNGANLRFDQLEAETSYHILVRHRNHLDVLSANPVIGSAVMAYDFTSGIAQAFSNNQQKAATDGKAVLFAGDYTADGVIQNSDRDAWLMLPAILNSYELTDGNLDGIVQVTDLDTWFPNRAKIGAVEIQF